MDNLGDTTGDTFVLVNDAVITVQHVLGNAILFGAEFCRTDINQDDIVNVIDIVLMVDIILN